MSVGSVYAVNRQSGLFIVAIEGGDFVVFEPLGGFDLSLGDKVSGDLEALGSVRLMHHPSQMSISVYGQSGPSSYLACRRLIG
jgi:hypothetical protein